MLVLLPLIACTDKEPAASDDDGFLRANTVRFLTPENGETTSSPLTLSWEMGSEVRAVGLWVDEVASGEFAANQAETTIEVDPGRHTLTVASLDTWGDPITGHTITVRVMGADIETTSWVSITSPPDGDRVQNPVLFTFDASSDIDRFALLDDGWQVASTDEMVLSHTFAGVGFERSITLQGYIGDDVVATDEISLEVTDPSVLPEQSLNTLIDQLLSEYPTDGTNGYYWPSNSDWAGTTQDIWYDGVLVAEGDPAGRCFCVGLTWEVYMRAFQIADAQSGGDGTLNGMSVDDVYDMRTDWFVRHLLGDGPAEGLDNYGLGTSVGSLDEIETGDFIQFWRHSGSGHNAIFIDWETNSKDQIIGVQYWSTQSSTDGIGYRSEYFGSGSSDIDPAYFFAGRAYEPEDWLPW